MTKWPPDWPNPYLDPNDTTHSPKDPTWTKDECFDAGQALAMMLLSRPEDAEQFRAIVEDAKLNGGERVRDYERIIGSAYDLAGTTDFNSNDFANVFRVAWLLIGRALTSLTNQNPHGDWVPAHRTARCILRSLAHATSTTITSFRTQQATSR